MRKVAAALLLLGAVLLILGLEGQAEGPVANDVALAASGEPIPLARLSVA